MRDIGGYPAAGGRRTRWRTLLRSDELTTIPRHAQAELVALGLRQVIDLRWPDEADRSPNVFRRSGSVRYRNIPLLAGRGPHRGVQHGHQRRMQVLIPPHAVGVRHDTRRVERVRPARTAPGSPSPALDPWACDRGDRRGLRADRRLFLRPRSAWIPDWRHEPLDLDSEPGSWRRPRASRSCPRRRPRSCDARGGTRDRSARRPPDRARRSGPGEAHRPRALGDGPSRRLLQIPYPPEPVFPWPRASRICPDGSQEVVRRPCSIRRSLGPRAPQAVSAAGAEFVGTVRRSPLGAGNRGSGGPRGSRCARLDPSARMRPDPLEIDLSTSPLFGFIAREAERRINAELPASLDVRAMLEAEEGAPSPQA